MYKTILRLYKQTGNEEVVLRAVEKGWIDEEEAAAILSQ